MPPARQFGTEISANRQRNHEFSPVQKSAMVAELCAGKSFRAVARVFNTTPSTTHKIFHRWDHDHTLEKKKRKGRPLKLTPAERRYIIILTKRERSITWAALVGTMGGRVHRDTIKRTLRSYWKRKWKAMQRIPLDKESARARLSFAEGWIEDVAELMEV